MLRRELLPLLGREGQHGQRLGGPQIRQRCRICPLLSQPDKALGSALGELHPLLQPGQPLPVGQHALGLDEAPAHIQDGLSAPALGIQDLNGDGLDVPALRRRGHGLGDEPPQVRLTHAASPPLPAARPPTPGNPGRRSTRGSTAGRPSGPRSSPVPYPCGG